MLWGRDGERARIDALLDGARRGRGGVLVVRGEAGIGKSALLADVRRRAASDLSVAAARAVEAESALAFSGLAELTDPFLSHLDTLLERQARALRAALALGPPTSHDPLAVCVATLALLAAAAEPRPLLVLVDDAHWLDASTTAALLFAARRIDVESVAVIMAVRDGVATESSSAIERAGLPELRLDGIDRTSAARMLSGQVPRLPEDVAELLTDATGGNPLALLEAARRLDEAQLAGLRPIEEPIPVGSVHEAFLARISGLPAATRRALLAAAVSDGESAATTIAAAGRLGIGEEAFAPAEAAGLVTLGVTGVTFQHPLLRSTVYHAASPADRRGAHRALAEVLVQTPRRRAWQLARAAVGPDEEAAQALEEVAAGEHARNGHAAATDAYTRAAELSADASQRAVRLLAAARASALAGQPERMRKLLDAALDLTDDAGIHAGATLLRAGVDLWRDPQGIASDLIEHGVRLESDDPSHSAQLLTTAGLVRTMCGQLSDALVTAERAHRTAAPCGGSVERAARAVLCNALALVGKTKRAAQLLDAEPWSVTAADVHDAPYTLPFAAMGLCLVGREEEAHRLLTGMITTTREVGAVAAVTTPLSLRAEVRTRLGRWPAAVADATESIQLARELGQLSELAHASVVLARIRAAQGREQECRSLVSRCRELTDRLGTDSLLSFAGAAIGLLELSLGRAEAAVAALEEVAELTDRHGVRHPAIVPWQPDLVEAYVRAGRREDAQRILDRLDREAIASESTWGLAVTARCRGLLADSDSFDDRFEAALRLHARFAGAFDRARTQLCYGERLRRRRQRAVAREWLHAAVGVFDRLGAAPWGERARVELDRVGAGVHRRPAPTLDVLTPRELQVALVVAEGATNQEAAVALFVSPKTIDFHLRNIYAKLGIRSRTELARLTLEQTGDA